MGHNINLDYAELNNEFESMLDEMYMMYHYHQSSIPHFELSEVERSEMSYFDSIGSYLGDDIGLRPSRKSKKVKFHANSEFCNGLPRRR
jgi:hypothetical protein